MLDVCLLGTGGMTPMPYRWLTSLVLRCGGSNILIDCGEGTQIAMKKVGWSPKPLDVICFTHFHADHIAGLPGMLLNISNSGRTEPIVLIGPKGLTGVVRALRSIVPELAYELRFIELDQNTEEYRIGPYVIGAFKVRHNISCYGYTVSVPRKGRFDIDAAKERNIPVMFWNRLQKGETVTDTSGGTVYTPDMVMGPDRKGLKITYTTDTRPCDNIVRAASGADLFICEGMYGEDGSEAKAKAYRHMTMRESALMAAAADIPPKELWFTHYSPSMLRPFDYIDGIRSIFPAANCGKDGMTKEFSFEEEGS